MADQEPIASDSTDPQPAASQTDPSTPAAAKSSVDPKSVLATPAAKPKKRRRWLFVLLSLPVLLLLLVVLIPSIASTGMVRGIVVSQVNKQLKGHVEIADWSIGWTGGIKVVGVKIFDVDSRQVGQLDSMSTQLKLTDAIKGKIALGETSIKGLDFTFTVYPDKTTTLDRLLKPSPDEPEKPASDLPEVSGKVSLEAARFTYVQDTGIAKTSHVVKLGLNGTIDIPDLLTSPIASNLDVQANIDNKPAGGLSLSGTSSVVTNKRINADAATIKQTLQLTDLDAAAAKAFAPPGLLRELAGKIGGQLDLSLDGGKSATFGGKLTGTAIAAATESFAAGEVYRTGNFTLQIPPTVMTLPQGLAKYEAGALKIGNGTSDYILVEADQLNLTLGADAPIAALLAVAKNERPTAVGNIRQTLNVDLAKVAGQLKGTIGLKPDVKMDAGRVEQSFSLALSNGKWVPAMSAKVLDVRGSAEFTGEDKTVARRPIAIDPITIDLKADSFGGGWKAPDLRDIILSFHSAFLNGEARAKTLASLDSTFKLDLAKLKQQAGQFASLDNYDIQGTGDLTASAKGDALKQDSPAELNVTADLRNVRVGLIAEKKSFSEPLIRFALGATILRNATGDIQGMTGLRIATLVGNEATPTVDFEAKAAEVKIIRSADPKGESRVDVPQFAITKGNIIFAQLQAELGSMMSLPTDLAVAGNTKVSGSGSFVNGSASFDGRLTVEVEKLTRTLAISIAGSTIKHPMEPLKNYLLTADLAASYTADPAGNNSAKVTRLSVTDNQGMLSLVSTGEIKVAIPRGSQLQAAGGLKLGLDIGAVNQMLRSLSASPQQVVATLTGKSADVTLRKGRVDGTINLSQPGDGTLRVALDGDLTDLTVVGVRPTDKPIIAGEKMKLVLRAGASGNFSAASLDQLDLTGDLATVSAKAQLALKTGPGADAVAVKPMAMVKNATLKASVADFKKIQAIIDVIPASSATPTAQIDDVTNRKATMLAAADDKAAAGVIVAAAATQPATAAGPSIMDQIAEVRLTELSAIGVGTVVTLKEPIVIRGLSDLTSLVPPSTATPATQPAVATEPAPPKKLAGGSALINLTIVGDGQQLTVTQDATIIGLVLSAGTVTHSVGDLSVQSKIAVVSKPAGAPAMPAKASIAGGINLKGQIEPLMQLSSAMGGKPASSPYAGAFNFDQGFTTEGTQIKLVGGGQVTDFVSRDAQNKPQFTEKSIRLTNGVALDTSGKMAVDLQQLKLAFESSGAMSLDASGKISELMTTRTFQNVVANVTYDGEQFWKIIHPMMLDPGTPPEKDRYKDYVIKGKTTRQFTVAGSYPAVDAAGNALPMNVAIRTLQARGSVGMEHIEAEGMKIEKLEVPIDLRAGILQIADLSKPAGQQFAAPAICNNGTLNLAGATVDLTQPVMTLTTLPNTPILKDVLLNSTLASFLGDFINNPALVKPGGTDGLMSVTIVDCRQIPLGAEAKLQSPNNKGHAVVTYTLGGLQLGNEFIAGLADKVTDLGSFRGEVRDGKVVYDNGMAEHSMTLIIGKDPNRTIKIDGKVRLSDKQLMPMNMFFSPGWINGGVSKEVARFIPQGLGITLTGTVSAPKYDFMAAVTENAKKNFNITKPEDIGNLIGQFSGNKKKDDPKKPGTGTPADNAAATKPAKPKDDLLGGLGGLFDQVTKDKEKEKKEKERKEKERKEKEKRDKEKQAK